MFCKEVEEGFLQLEESRIINPTVSWKDLVHRLPTQASLDDITGTVNDRARVVKFLTLMTKSPSMRLKD